jgi:hypothetical protein
MWSVGAIERLTDTNHGIEQIPVALVAQVQYGHTARMKSEFHVSGYQQTRTWWEWTGWAATAVSWWCLEEDAGRLRCFSPESCTVRAVPGSALVVSWDWGRKKRNELART